MNRSTPQNGRIKGGVWAGVAASPSGHRVVVARRSRTWEVIEARTFPVEDKAGLAALFERHAVSRVIRVAPPAEVVSRVVNVPAGEPAQMAAALSLLAEAELPEAIPSHRRAGGVIEKTIGAEGVPGLVTGWVPGAPREPLTDADERWVAAAGALAALRHTGKYAVWADRATGSIVALCSGDRRLVCRTLLEHRDADGAWDRSLAAAVSETAEAAGLAGAPARPGLTLDAPALAALASSVSGIDRASAWLDEYGLALGALLVAGSDDASVASLATMTPEPVAVERSWVVRAVDRLTDPRRAAVAFVAALAALLVIPLGLAYARLAVLDARVNRISGGQGATEGLSQRARLYEELDKQRLPMTKLLADIAGAAPIGVTVESIRISKEQGLSLLGTAESQEKLNQFQANLNRTGVFSRATVNRSEAAATGGVSFDLSSQIDQPHVLARPAEDLGGKTLAEALYGEGASNDSFHAGESGPRRNGRRPAGVEGAARSGSAGPNADASRRPQEPSSAPPEPLTNEAIAKMTDGEAAMAWTTRRAYIQKNPSLDSGTRQRLQDEIDRIRSRPKGGS